MIHSRYRPLLVFIYSFHKTKDTLYRKFYLQVVLTEQAFIRTPDISVTDRIKEVEKQTGAKIKVLDFVRLELGAEE